MKNLQPTVDAVIGSIGAEADEVQAIFEDLTQLQAIYVAAKAAHRLHLDGANPSVFANEFDLSERDIADELMATLRAASNGQFEEIVIDLSNQTRSVAVAIVGSAEDMRPGFAVKVAAQCLRVYDSPESMGA